MNPTQASTGMGAEPGSELPFLSFKVLETEPRTSSQWSTSTTHLFGVTHSSVTLQAGADTTPEVCLSLSLCHPPLPTPRGLWGCSWFSWDFGGATQLLWAEMKAEGAARHLRKAR